LVNYKVIGFELQGEFASDYMPGKPAWEEWWFSITRQSVALWYVHLDCFAMELLAIPVHS
jgi:hypothetical protein